MLDVTGHNFTQVQNFMPTCMGLIYSLLRLPWRAADAIKSLAAWLQIVQTYAWGGITFTALFMLTCMRRIRSLLRSPWRAADAIMSSPTKCSKRSLPNSALKNSAWSMKSTSMPSAPCWS